MKFFKKSKDKEEVEGSTSKEELKFLQVCVGELSRGSVVVEIGSHRGRSAIAMGKIAIDRGVLVYAVDPHLPFTGVNGREFGPTDLDYMYGALVEHGVGESVFVVSLKSTKAAMAWDDSSVDLLFLDGDHSDAAVRADVSAWSSKIRPGGKIAFHDSYLDGVKSTILELESTGYWSRVNEAGSIVALCRNDA